MRISASLFAVCGVLLEGLTITALPAAMAGAILCATVFAGALNGVIAHTTPSGTGMVKPSLSCLLWSALERDHLAGEAAGLLGGQSEGLDAPPQLALRIAERESGFTADDLNKLLAAALDERRRAIQDRSAVVSGERRLHMATASCAAATAART